MNKDREGGGSGTDDDIVTVFATSDMVEMISAKLRLDGEGIPYAVIGEAVQNLVGLGTGVGFTDPMQLRVRSADEARAREVITNM